MLQKIAFAHLFRRMCSSTSNLIAFEHVFGCMNTHFSNLNAF